MRVNTPVLHSKAHAQADRVLSQLRATAPQMGLAAWVSMDGFVLASAAEARIQPERIGAMSASLLALSRCALQEVGAGQLRQVIVGGSTGMMVVTEAGAGRALVLATESGANVSHVLLDAQKAAVQLALISEVVSWHTP